MTVEWVGGKRGKHPEVPPKTGFGIGGRREVSEGGGDWSKLGRALCLSYSSYKQGYEQIFYLLGMRLRDKQTE